MRDRHSRWSHEIHFSIKLVSLCFFSLPHPPLYFPLSLSLSFSISQICSQAFCFFCSPISLIVRYSRSTITHSSHGPLLLAVPTHVHTRATRHTIHGRTNSLAIRPECSCHRYCVKWIKSFYECIRAPIRVDQWHHQWVIYGTLEHTSILCCIGLGVAMAGCFFFVISPSYGLWMGEKDESDMVYRFSRTQNGFVRTSTGSAVVNLPENLSSIVHISQFLG